MRIAGLLRDLLLALTVITGFCLIYASSIREPLPSIRLYPEFIASQEIMARYGVYQAARNLAFERYFQYNDKLLLHGADTTKERKAAVEALIRQVTLDTGYSTEVSVPEVLCDELKNLGLAKALVRWELQQIGAPTGGSTLVRIIKLEIERAQPLPDRSSLRGFLNDCAETLQKRAT